MKIIIDLDPKLQRKLEVLANARGKPVSDVTAELLSKIMSREGSASSSADGIPSPAMTEAVKKAAASASAPVAPTGISIDDLVLLLETLVARFRLADVSGKERRALLAELAMLPPDQAVTRLVGLLQQSLG